MNKAPIRMGSQVVSLAGRDEGRIFLVVGQLDEAYVLISDGATHKMEKPKKKKIRHLKQILPPTEEIVNALESGRLVANHEVRQWLSREEG